MKHFKRAAAMLLAVVLSLCLAVTAFAEGTAVTTGSLTVTGPGLTGKKVTAVRMFTANANTNAETSKDNDFDSYTLEDAWLEFFKLDPRYTAVKNAGNITSVSPSDQEVKDAVVAYVESLRASEKDLAKLADDAQTYYRNNASTFTTTMKKESEPATDVAGTPTATIAELQSGYYLVFPEMGSTGNPLPSGGEKRGTDAMLVNVPKNGAKTEAVIKSTYPTVEKKVKNSTDEEFKPNGTAQVGEKVTFQLTAEVPDMSDYTKYTFKFVDTMTKGLDFVSGSVKVTIADKNIDAGDNTYKVNFDTAQKALTVTFDNLKKVNKEENTPVATGDKIVVTYEAYINKDASHTDPATNKVHLEYSNNPDGTGTGTSNPDESKVYTYEIKIDKFYKDNETDKPLAGATFTLTKSETDSTNGIDLIKDAAAEGTTGLVYHVKGNDETGESTKVVTTDATGKITIKGLKEGTYYLHETAAPTGFNKLTHPIKIQITVDSENYTAPAYKVNDKNNADNTIKVENVKGVMLPETGSIGTIGLTTLGVAVVLLGVFAPRKKKKENQ